MKSFRNKTVFITGGSSGIGFAAAREFLRQGARVLLIARNTGRLEKAKESLTKVFPGTDVATLSLDISEARKEQAGLEEKVTGFGSPDLLINCAGIAYPDYFEAIPDKIFESTIRINLMGTWYMTKILLPHMKSGSVIVNVSSTAGLFGVFGYTAYGATKGAIVNFSETLRCELKPKGIQVNILCPPDTDTPQLAGEEATKPAETKAIAGNAKVFPPETVAKALLKGIRKNRFLIIPDFMGKFSHLVYRIIPGFVRWFMDNDVKKVHKKSNQDLTRQQNEVKQL